LQLDVEGSYEDDFGICLSGSVRRTFAYT